MRSIELKKEWVKKAMKNGLFGYCKICGNPNKEGYTKNHFYCSYKCNGIARKLETPEGNRICKNCGKQFRTNPAYVKRRKNAGLFCNRNCWLIYKRKNPSRKIDKFGYIRVGKIREHRLIIENLLNRKLNRDEVIHHKNGVKTDNRIENLEIMTNSNHTICHQKIDSDSKLLEETFKKLR